MWTMQLKHLIYKLSFALGVVNLTGPAMMATAAGFLPPRATLIIV